MTAEQIGKAGLQAFVIMFGGKKNDSLNSLRYAKFMEMVTSNKSSLDPQNLPPTERPAYFHSLRGTYRSYFGKEFVNNDLNPEQWGWKLGGTMLVPAMTDLAPAPEILLNFVRRKCKLASKNPCGLKCVTACRVV